MVKLEHFLESFRQDSVGVRCVVCTDSYSARLSRQHNDTNILAFGARVVGPATAEMLVYEFLNTEFEGGRHQHRADMTIDIENKD